MSGKTGCNLTTNELPAKPTPRREALSWVLAGIATCCLSLPMAAPAASTTVCQYPKQTATYETSACNTQAGLTWPTTWTPIHSLNDPAGDIAAGGTDNDIVGSTNYPAVYSARNGNYLFFRMRVNYAGTVTTPLTSPFLNDGLLLLIQSDTTKTAPEYAIAWDIQDSVNHGMEMQVRKTGGSGAAWTATSMEDVDNSNGQKLAPDINNGSRTGDGFIRTVDQQATEAPFGGGTAPYYTTYVDFAISCSYLNYLSGYSPQPTGITPNLACGQPWYLQVATIHGATDHANINADVAGGVGKIDTAPVPTVPATLTGSFATGGSQIQWPVQDTAFLGAWPSDAQWSALTGLNDPGNDAAAGGQNSVLNFVGDADNPGFYIAKKTVSGTAYLFFRIRVNWSGTVIQPVCTNYPNGCTSAAPFGGGSNFTNGSGRGSILLYISKTATGSTTPEYAFSWDFASTGSNAVYAHGMEMSKLSSGGGGTWNNLKMADVDGNDGGRAAPDFNNSERPGVGATPPYYGTDAYIRTIDGIPCVGCTGQVTGRTTFVDFAISCPYLNYVTGVSGSGVSLTCGNNVYFQIGSMLDNTDHASPNVDIAGGVASLETAINGTLKGPVATYAIISNFSAMARGHQVIVEWETEVEANTQGFELQRQNAMGEFEPVHAGLLTGHGPSGEGGKYRFADATALPGLIANYRLIEVEASGQRREVGETTLLPDARTEAASGLDLFPGQVSYSPRTVSGTDQARLNARRLEKALERAGARGVAGHRAAIGVVDSGLYYVDGDALARALDWPAGKIGGMLQGRQLRVTQAGEDIAWLANGKGGLYFYGQAPTDPFSTERVYVIQQGQGTTMADSKVRTGGPAGAGSFPSIQHYEQNLFAATVMGKDPDEDFFHWALFNATGTACAAPSSACRSRDFALDVANPAASGNGQLILQLRGVTSLAANPDHAVRVSLNGTVLGIGRWDGLDDYTLVLPFTQSGGLLKNGTNTVKVEALLDTGVSSNAFYLDRFELSYPRLYRASGESLQLTGPAGQGLTVSGFADSALAVFELDDPKRPKTVSGARLGGTAGNYALSFVPAASDTPYLVLSPAAIRSPVSLRPLQETGLAEAGAPYLIIGPEDFAADAQRLIDFRAGRGLRGRFVSVESIYDEFGYGQKTPHAIRAFLRQARQRWPEPPRYVVLAGKGSFDPKNYLGYDVDRVPVLMALTEAGLIAADQRYADGDGDGLADFAIGRLPAITTAEFAQLVDKLIAYESAPPAPNRVFLLAGKPDNAGNFTAESELIAAALRQAGVAEGDILRGYLERQSLAEVRTGLFGALNGGIRLLNYTGHAGVTSLGSDGQLLKVSDANALTNPVQPLMIGATCYMNRFEFPNYTSLGESLVLNPRGGAIAVWSSGGFSYSTEIERLNEAFIQALVAGRPDSRIGDLTDAALNGKMEFGHGNVARLYNFLGDPAGAGR